MYTIKSKNDYTIQTIKEDGENEVYFFVGYENSIKFIKGEKVKDFIDKEVQMQNGERVLYFYLSYEIVEKDDDMSYDVTDGDFDIETMTKDMVSQSSDTEVFKSKKDMIDWINSNVVGYDGEHYIVNNKKGKSGITRIVSVAENFDASRINMGA